MPNEAARSPSARKGGREREERAASRSEDEAIDSFFEVPAAVLCAICGEADCPGCSIAEENASGVIAIVPWERGRGGVWTRLWATANATTLGAEAFFAVLPDGEIRPAMRFAVLAEFLAVASMGALLLPLAAIAFPGVALLFVENATLRASALRWVILGLPAMSLMMVAAHVTHGAALDVGARRQGAAPQRRRAVRFGLYACGWDLMSGPLGALVTLIGQGGRALRGALDGASGAPRRASQAFLEGVYHLSPEQIARSRRYGNVAAAAITILIGFVIVGLLFAGAWSVWSAARAHLTGS